MGHNKSFNSLHAPSAVTLVTLIAVTTFRGNFRNSQTPYSQHSSSPILLRKHVVSAPTSPSEFSFERRELDVVEVGDAAAAAISRPRQRGRGGGTRPPLSRTSGCDQHTPTEYTALVIMSDAAPAIAPSSAKKTKVSCSPFLPLSCSFIY